MEIKAGKLVSFMIVETQIDVIEPIGLPDRKLVNRLVDRGGLYHPVPGEIGLVIRGPECPEESNSVRLWEVLVGGRQWWFDEEHLVDVTRG